jgi:hypothetical protein
METLASDLAEALALKERMKSGEVAGDELDVSLTSFIPCLSMYSYATRWSWSA